MVGGRNQQVYEVSGYCYPGEVDESTRIPERVGGNGCCGLRPSLEKETPYIFRLIIILFK